MCQGLGPKKHDEISETDRTDDNKANDDDNDNIRLDDTVKNPHRAQMYRFGFFELIPLLELDKRFPVEQFEAAVSQSTIPSPPLISAPRVRASLVLCVIHRVVQQSFQQPTFQMFT